MPLQRALLLLIAATLLVGIMASGAATDRRLARELESRARNDLREAPGLLADRNAAVAEGLVMHARAVAQAPGLAEAMLRGDSAVAVRAARAARGSYGDAVVLITRDGRAWDGPSPGVNVARATMRGEAAVAVVSDSATLNSVALAPIIHRGQWIGAAGVAVMLGQPAAGVLAAATRSDVLIMTAGGRVTAATTADTIARIIAGDVARSSASGVSGARDATGARAGQVRDTVDTVREVVDRAHRYLVASTALGDGATMVFVHDLTRDLEVLPRFRGVIAASGFAALLFGMLVGAIAAVRIARPVRALADAADRLAAGDVAAPLMPSSIREIDRMADAFGKMRVALVGRMSDAMRANQELADRQIRLESAQSELLHRERLAVSNRLIAEMSHEIRNPIANLRNCLEIIRRRVETDPQALEFTELAIDELLRMHELAEQMLDLNRPRGSVVQVCHPRAVAREVAALVSAGLANEHFRVEVESAGDPTAAIAPDSFKQVLLNLLQNAREAIIQHAQSTRVDKSSIRVVVSQSADMVSIDVTDDGPGISPDVLPRVFDPFFTTKGAANGVGLGLFVAQGLVRNANGRLSVANRTDRRGAHFHIELPVARDQAETLLEVSA